MPVGDGGSQPWRPNLKRLAKRLFKEIDADGDETISRDEIAAKLRTDDELQALMVRAGKAAAYIFEQLDTDGDGSITLDEFLRIVDPAEEDRQVAEAAEPEPEPEPELERKARQRNSKWQRYTDEATGETFEVNSVTKEVRWAGAGNDDDDEGWEEQRRREEVARRRRAQRGQGRRGGGGKQGTSRRRKQKRFDPNDRQRKPPTPQSLYQQSQEFQKETAGTCHQP